MQTSEEYIKRIEGKLLQLVKEFHQSQKEIQRLQKENMTLHQQLATNTKHSDDLAQTIDVLKIHSLTQNDSSKKELEKRINTYLKEIDKCLNLLQS